MLHSSSKILIQDGQEVAGTGDGISAAAFRAFVCRTSMAGRKSEERVRLHGVRENWHQGCRSEKLTLLS